MNWLLKGSSATTESTTTTTTAATTAETATRTATAVSKQEDIERSDTIRIYEDDMMEMCSSVAKHPQVETGGDLFGFITPKKQYIISKAIGPGSGAEHLVTCFIQDEKYFEKIEKILSQHGLSYLGNWHCHHTLSPPVPTSNDCTTIANWMQQKNMGQFIQILAAIDPHTNKITVKPYLFTKGASGYKNLQFSVIPGVSPYSQLTSEVSKEFMATPVPVAAADAVDSCSTSEAITSVSESQSPSATMATLSQPVDVKSVALGFIPMKRRDSIILQRLSRAESSI